MSHEIEHGEWIPCGDGEHTPLMCSKCLNTWSFYKKRGSKYCPNCGIKMINPWDGKYKKEGERTKC